MGRHAGTPKDDSTGGAVRLDARVLGIVQGVGFRYWTMAKAEELGLSGEVANLDDGSVSVVAEGPEPEVRQLLEWLNSGSTPGRVERVDGSTSPAGGGFRGFRAY